MSPLNSSINDTEYLFKLGVPFPSSDEEAISVVSSSGSVSVMARAIVSPLGESEPAPIVRVTV